MVATNEPACTTPKARKQLFMSNDAALMAFPAAEFRRAASAKALKEDGTSQEEDSWSLIATSARRRPEIRL